MTTFTELSLSPSLIKAVEELSYTTPTEIQAEAIPMLLESDVDFVGQAQTGTGKTAAFALPLLDRLNPYKKGIQALILAPTRELATQVENEIKKLAKFTAYKTVCVYGGDSYTRQITAIRKDKPAIVVGTPGRVIDLLEKRILNFDESEFLILDEADEMLKMGFFDDVQTLLSSFGDDRKIWMFSATMPRPILNMIQNDFRTPICIKIDKKTLSNDDIEQRYYVVQQRHKAEALVRLLSIEPETYGIVFCNTKAETKNVTAELLDRGFAVDCLNGDMGQTEREQTMARFKSQKVKLLICTDVAARGIDVNNLTHVFNMGFPQDFDSYVHRIGRTGRAGSTGIAITLVDPRDMRDLRRIESITKKQMVEHQLPNVSQLKSAMISAQLERLGKLKTSILEKGESFKIDSSFSVFNEFFEDMESEDVRKVLFAFLFNRDLQRLNDMGELEARRPRPVDPQGRSAGGSRDRNFRGGGSRGGRPQGRRDGPKREEAPPASRAYKGKDGGNFKKEAPKKPKREFNNY